MVVQAHPGTRSSFSARSFPANNVFQNVVPMLIKNIVLLLQGSMSKMASTGIEPATLALLAPRSNQLRLDAVSSRRTHARDKRPRTPSPASLHNNHAPKD